MKKLIMRNRNRRWILFWFLVPILQLNSTNGANDTNDHPESDNGDRNIHRLFSPRMDYDQWKPLGRGDPLKNDPTYDYLPPVLDRVHYWKSDPPTRGDNPKTEILLLGVTSKKPAKITSQADSRQDDFDSHIKFIQNPNQRVAKPSFIPSVTTSFFPSFYPPKNKYSMRTSFSKGSEQRMPYTVLMPPPMPIISQQNGPVVTQSPTGFTNSKMTTIFKSSTKSSVTVQPSNLVYQSSSPIQSTDWSNKQVTIDSSVAWEQHLPSTQQPTSAFRESLIYNTHLAPPDSYINIEFAPHNLSNSSLVAAESQTINYVTPPPLDHPEEIMFKGQVADDSLDISNTYVKIVKPEAEVHSTGIGMDDMFPQVINVEEKKFPPMLMQTLQEMQTMHPPPLTQTPVYTKSTTNVNFMMPMTTTSTLMVPITDSPILNNISSMVATNIPPPTTSRPVIEPITATIEASDAQTTVGSLTTDPLFKHYKQPKEPMKGPLYLIIQGHSKVKTYGPSKQLQGINIQETNEIPDSDYGYLQVKHLHGFHMEKLVEPRMARSGNLQTLKHVVQTGYGAIDLSDLDEMIKKHFQEAEVQGGYEVVDDEDFAEEYHKGIVEEARKLTI